MQYFATPGTTVYYYSEYRKVVYDLPESDGVKYRCYDTDANLHCTDGPSVVYMDGTTLWFWHGGLLNFDAWLAMLPVNDEEKVMLKLKYG